MRLERSPLLRALRTLVMGLLVLAIVGKPVLAELCNVHALTHEFATQAEGAGKAPAHVDTAAEARSDLDHASGAHQLLHAFDASPAFVELFPTLAVPPSRFDAIAPPVYRALAPPVRTVESPFRPPIA